MIVWLDLLIGEDTHPRRFDGPESLRAFALKMERLSEEAAEALLREGQVGPPLARREYRVRPLGPQRAAGSAPANSADTSPANTSATGRAHDD